MLVLYYMIRVVCSKIIWHSEATIGPTKDRVITREKKKRDIWIKKEQTYRKFRTEYIEPKFGIYKPRGKFHKRITGKLCYNVTLYPWLYIS